MGNCLSPSPLYVTSSYNTLHGTTNTKILNINGELCHANIDIMLCSKKPTRIQTKAGNQIEIFNHQLIRYETTTSKNHKYTSATYLRISKHKLITQTEKRIDGKLVKLQSTAQTCDSYVKHPINVRFKRFNCSFHTYSLLNNNIHKFISLHHTYQKMTLKFHNENDQSNRLQRNVNITCYLDMSNNVVLSKHHPLSIRYSKSCLKIYNTTDHRIYPEYNKTYITTDTKTNKDSTNSNTGTDNKDSTNSNTGTDNKDSTDSNSTDTDNKDSTDSNSTYSINNKDSKTDTNNEDGTDTNGTDTDSKDTDNKGSKDIKIDNKEWWLDYTHEHKHYFQSSLPFKVSPHIMAYLELIAKHCVFVDLHKFFIQTNDETDMFSIAEPSNTTKPFITDSFL